MAKYSTIRKKVLIIIHLFYLDTIKNYWHYIKEIPGECDVIFTASSTKHREVLKNYLIYKNWVIIDKKNRGRDISALLVAAGKYIKNYDYVCFIHDKKAKNKQTENDFANWTKNLWNNSVGSKQFIYNVINEFENNECLGMLVPPAPLGEYTDAALENAWYGNYDCAIKLADQLGIKRPIYSISPISLGTVFWAKTAALKKLIEPEWKYEDFPEEPLPVDNVISYAVERILSFVVEDAGYDVKVVMDENSIIERYEQLEKIGENALQILRDYNIMSSTNNICSYKNKIMQLWTFIGNSKKLYIYGAGGIGQKCAAFLINNKIDFNGFIVSNSLNNPETLKGKKVIEVNQLKELSDCKIIIAMNSKNKEEVIQLLNKKGFSKNNIFEY